MSPLVAFGLYLLGGLVYLTWVGAHERGEEGDALVMAVMAGILVATWPLCVAIDVALVFYRFGRAMGRHARRS